MPFSSNPLLAPVFQSPVGDGRDHRPPVVSIKRAEDAVESGIRLHHNQRVEGYILQPEVEGLGVAPVELQTAPLASGGSVARHARLTEGDVFLPITLVSPVPSALPGMFDALVEIARPGQRGEDGLPLQFEVVVYDPYGQETRSRRLIFESGLGDPVRVNHHIWRTSITGRFVDPFWYGTVRELRRTLGSVDKKFITASRGRPDATFGWEGEPNSSPSLKSVKGELVARNVYPDPTFVSSDHDIRTAHTAIDFKDSPVGDGRLVRVEQTTSGTFTFISVRDAARGVVLGPGQFVVVAANILVSSGSRVSARYGLNDGEWVYEWSGHVTGSGWQRVVFDPVEVEGEHVGEMLVNFYLNDGSSETSQPADGSWFELANLQVAVADSASEVLGQVDSFFYGGMPDGYQTSVSSPVTYEWEGTPGDSPSVKRVNGEIVARNLVHDPSFEHGLEGVIYTSGIVEPVRSQVDDRFRSGKWGMRTRGNGESTALQYVYKNIDGLSGGDWVAASVYVQANGGAAGQAQLRFGFSGGGPRQYVDVASWQNVVGGWHRLAGAAQVPEGYTAAWLMVYVSNVASSTLSENAFHSHDDWQFAVADSEQAALDQVAEYFDGDTPDEPGQIVYDGPGAYEFPFFPVRIGGSVVQGEYELQVEGDAPAYWSGVITPPGEDLLIQNAKGERIFVQGRVDEPILIQTRPQEQDITLADGTPIWDRIDPGDDDFFPLHPGRNTVRVSMVGATQQSEILIRYREAFFHSLGGGS